MTDQCISFHICGGQFCPPRQVFERTEKVKAKPLIFILILLLAAGYAAITAYMITSPTNAVLSPYYQAMDVLMRIAPILIALVGLLGILAGLGRGKLWIILMIVIIAATPFMWRFAKNVSDDALIKVIVEDVELIEE